MRGHHIRRRIRWAKHGRYENAGGCRRIRRPPATNTPGIISRRRPYRGLTVEIDLRAAGGCAARPGRRRRCGRSSRRCAGRTPTWRPAAWSATGSSTRPTSATPRWSARCSPPTTRAVTVRWPLAVGLRARRRPAPLRAAGDRRGRRGDRRACLDTNPDRVWLEPWAPVVRQLRVALQRAVLAGPGRLGEGDRPGVRADPAGRRVRRAQRRRGPRDHPRPVQDLGRAGQPARAARAALRARARRRQRRAGAHLAG